MWITFNRSSFGGATTVIVTVAIDLVQITLRIASNGSKSFYENTHPVTLCSVSVQLIIVWYCISSIVEHLQLIICLYVFKFQLQITSTWGIKYKVYHKGIAIVDEIRCEVQLVAIISRSNRIRFSGHSGNEFVERER